MIICVVCDVLGKANNGTTMAALDLIQALKERGHLVRVVCPDLDRMGQENFYVVPVRNLGPLNNYLQKNGVELAKPERRILEQAMHGADHVHIMLPFPLGIKALKVAKEHGLPVTAGFHCQAENFTSHIFMKDFKPANTLTYKTFYRLFYRHVDAVHYPTEFIRETFENATGKTNAYVISNGVRSAFQPAPSLRPKELEGRFVILFIGRYSKEKAHKVLIDAAALSRHAKELQLIFAGSGPLREKLEKRSRKLANPPIFRFFSRDELVRAINYADLYVHPSEVEIEAISCLEAISCGLVPVISDSYRSATRFFALDEKNLFACNDPQALADRIDYWLEHPAERQERSRAYLGYTVQFNYENCMDRMEQMIVETHDRVRSGKC